jgi:anti-sigma regulatory factor (Ser/Thr protein kinase)
VSRQWSHEAPALPREVPAFRHGLVAFARTLELEDRLVGDIALALTEAVTNAVIHAYVGQDPGTVQASAAEGDGELVVRVWDAGHGMRPRSDSPGLGLGLPTIGRLARHFDVGPGPDGAGTEVRMTFAAPQLVPAGRPADAARRDRVEAILAALDEAITVSDRAGHVVWANHAAVELVGAASLEELQAVEPGTLAARFHPVLEDGRPLTADLLPGRRLLAGQPAGPLLVGFRDVRTGEQRWVSIRSHLLDGEPGLVVNVMVDVTEFRRA